MTIEIHKAELVKRVNAQISSGQFHDADEVIEKALDALEERASNSCNAARLGDERMGVDLIAALQASPHREQEIEPMRFRLAMPLRDVTF